MSVTRPRSDTIVSSIEGLYSFVRSKAANFGFALPSFLLGLVTWTKEKPSTSSNNKVVATRTRGSHHIRTKSRANVESPARPRSTVAVKRERPAPRATLVQPCSSVETRKNEAKALGFKRSTGIKEMHACERNQLSTSGMITHEPEHAYGLEYRTRHRRRPQDGSHGTVSCPYDDHQSGRQCPGFEVETLDESSSLQKIDKTGGRRASRIPLSAGSPLTDGEALELVKNKKISPYLLEELLDDPTRAVKIRRLFYEHETKNEGIEDVPYLSYDYNKVSGACCENVIGYVGLPVGIVGPLIVDGEPIYVPLATTEGCLVASVNRGASAIRRSAELSSSTSTNDGHRVARDDSPARNSTSQQSNRHPDLGYDVGVRTFIFNDGKTRGPIVQFPNVLQASECMRWLQSENGFAFMKNAFDATSNYARLNKVRCHIAGRSLYIRFVATTGDAMGMNMVSKGCEAAVKALVREKYPKATLMSLSGNLCSDKKMAALNWVEGRGRSVTCEARIAAEVVRNHLKTDVETMVQLNTSKSLVGSALAGSIGGFNSQAANVVAALFIACGQDPAQVVESSGCVTQMEAIPSNVKNSQPAAGSSSLVNDAHNNHDLYVSVTMPCIEVGTVGGGTVLPAQAACLKVIGVHGSGDPAGSNARKLARVVAASVLAGEVSLVAALASGDLVKSHLTHNRSTSEIQAGHGD